MTHDKKVRGILEKIIINYNTKMKVLTIKELKDEIIDQDFSQLNTLKPKIDERELKEAIEKEITEMQEIVDDKEANPEMRSNARSYIRGIKKACAIAQKAEEIIK